MNAINPEICSHCIPSPIFGANSHSNLLIFFLFFLSYFFFSFFFFFSRAWRWLNRPISSSSPRRWQQSFTLWKDCSCLWWVGQRRPTRRSHQPVRCTTRWSRPGPCGASTWRASSPGISEWVFLCFPLPLNPLSLTHSPPPHFNSTPHPSFGSPWYNHNGWLGVEHQLAYLLTGERKDITTLPLVCPCLTFPPLRHSLSHSRPLLLLPWCFTSTETVRRIREGGRMG